MNKTVVYHGIECKIEKEKYQDNGRVALVLTDAERGFPVAIATINVPEEELKENEVVIKNYSENAGLLDILIENGIVEYTGRTVTTGFVTSPICVLKI